MRAPIVALTLAAAGACAISLGLVAGVVWRVAEAPMLAPAPLSAPSTAGDCATCDRYRVRVVFPGLAADVSAAPPILVALPRDLPPFALEPQPAPPSAPSARAAEALVAWEASAGVAQWRGLASEIFPAENVERLLRVMTCESGGNPNATGGAGERGLMQIHPIHADSTYDPRGNLAAAARISDYGRTFSAWDGPTPGRGEAWAAGAPCRGPYGGGS